MVNQEIFENGHNQTLAEDEKRLLNHEQYKRALLMQRIDPFLFRELKITLLEMSRIKTDGKDGSHELNDDIVGQWKDDETDNLKEIVRSVFEAFEDEMRFYEEFKLRIAKILSQENKYIGELIRWGTRDWFRENQHRGSYAGLGRFFDSEMASELKIEIGFDRFMKWGNFLFEHNF